MAAEQGEFQIVRTGEMQAAGLLELHRVGVIFEEIADPNQADSFGPGEDITVKHQAVHYHIHVGH